MLNLLPYGPLDYLDVDAIQRELHANVAHGCAPDTFILWEAQHIYTAGRRTADRDIPDTSVPVISMDRGGSVTYHGPGQLIVYPIVKVRSPQDVVAFVRSTERAIEAAMLSAFGIQTSQVRGRSGAWILDPEQIDRKLCAIGIKFASEVTMHGLALNVATDLSMFERVIPCGLSDAGVTSLQELGVTAELQDVAEALVPELARAYAPFLERSGSTAVNSFEHCVQLNAQKWLSCAPLLRKNQELNACTGVAWKPRGADQVESGSASSIVKATEEASES